MKTYSDIKGDGGSNVLGQISELRAAIDERLGSVSRKIAVCSGKGGVGKSTLTMALARALASQGLLVSLLDLDFNGPSLAHLAGLEDVVFVPGQHGLCPPKTEDGIAVLSFGSFLEPGATLDFSSTAHGDTQTWRATKEFSVLADLLAKTDWGRRDVLLLDLPPGADRTFQFAEFFGPSLEMVLVSTPSPLAAGVVKRSLTALKKTPNRLLGYIENMAGYYCHDCLSVKPLFPEGDLPELDICKLGSVPFDPALSTSSGKETSLSLGAIDEIACLLTKNQREENEISVRAL